MIRRTMVLASLLTSFTNLPTSGLEPSSDSLTVVYDHVSGKAGGDLEPGFGFSAFVRFNGKVILFDTGGERSILARNLKTLKLDSVPLDAVVISHNHWDHVYGLPAVAGNTPAYVPGSALDGIRQQNPRASLVAVEESMEIAPRTWVVGPMSVEYRGVPLSEQVLVLEKNDGLAVIVGCSHPGIVAIVETVKERFGDRSIALIAGGMHLRDTSESGIESIASDLKRLGVNRIAPSHCTGDRAVEIFRRHWTGTVLPFDLGDRLPL
jgi:7,8-dihydropterin-6-yl-methyl-4-(beta-D-ribofuranosyl)aminobenzene 5'-phosphate synthase